MRAALAATATSSAFRIQIRDSDVFGRVQVGVVYTGGTKIAEHGGDNPGDRGGAQE